MTKAEIDKKLSDARRKVASASPNGMIQISRSASKSNPRLYQSALTESEKTGKTIVFSISRREFDGLSASEQDGFLSGSKGIVTG